MRMIHGDVNQNNISDVVTWCIHYDGPRHRVCIDGHQNNTSKPHRLHTGSGKNTVGLLYMIIMQDIIMVAVVIIQNIKEVIQEFSNESINMAKQLFQCNKADFDCNKAIYDNTL